MERSIQGLWTKLDDYGTGFVEQAMEEMEAQHRRQGEQLRTMRRIVGQQSLREPLAGAGTGAEGQEDGGVEGVAKESDNEEEVEEVKGRMWRTKWRIVKNGKQVAINRPYYYRRRNYDSEGALIVLADEIAGLYEQLPEKDVKAKMRSYVMEPRSAPYEVLWNEWFSAKEGRPSIWSMDKYALEWRTYQDSASKQRYYFKKKIVRETLKVILAAQAEAEGNTSSGTLEERVMQGKKTTQEMILRHGNISKFLETLRQHRTS
ncbi:hypothetical protein BGZ95_005483 [Linnemannia exigua]|uniref:Transcription activator GCR1-like domain-containing protein n=1 Tax=Linnemannia exigua TaxID=604196 RepID=A0AAD4H2I8_9FUNG|nr:hypothetical protein BGZ95_005483 [Linnemannia exigua]